MTSLDLKFSPAEYLSKRYQHVDTRELIKHFGNAGFNVAYEGKTNLKRPIDPSLNPLWNTYTEDDKVNLFSKYAKQLSRYEARLGHERHMIKFQSNALGIKAKGHDMFVRVTNSDDGSSSLKVSLDILRLVCLNGMVAPRQIFEYSIKHSNKNIFQSAIEASYKIIDQKELIDEQIDAMSSKVLNQDEKILLIDNMFKIRYGDETELVLDPSKKLELLKPKRIEEGADNLYQNFNTLQEKLTRGSKVTLLDANGNPITRTVREVKSQVTADQFNNDSWNFAYSLAS